MTLPLPILMAFLICLPLYAQDIPQQLQSMGFTENTLIKYEEREGKEYYIFSDWMTKESGDTIVFVIGGGKVIESFQGAPSWNGEIIEEGVGI